MNTAKEGLPQSQGEGGVQEPGLEEREARERAILQAARTSAIFQEEKVLFDKGVPVRERLQRVEPWGIGPRFGKAAFPTAGKMKVLDGQCAAREEGWWHYEVCHGRNVTQFRTKPVENCVGCHPERTNVHSLGIFDGIVPAVAADGDGDKEPEHQFVAGDGCGADQMARYTKVVYKCVAGVWALDDRIESIHEYEMCKYRIVVLTSKACNESLHHSVQGPHSPVGTTRLHSGTWQRGGVWCSGLAAARGGGQPALQMRSCNPLMQCALRLRRAVQPWRSAVALSRGAQLSTCAPHACVCGVRFRSAPQLARTLGLPHRGAASSRPHQGT